VKSILLALILLLAPAGACGLDIRAEFIEVGEDMEGGVVPSDPSLMVLILKKPDGSAVILTRRRGQVYSRGTLESFQRAVADPMSKLGLLLLPSEPESRSGLSDAYGLKRSLHVHLGGKCWRHAPPAGCVHDAPTIKPNAEQKKVFARATSEIAALASRAREKATERDWDLAWKQLEKKKPASGGPVPGSP